MHGVPIRIETLGDLAAHGFGMNATCERCRHRSDLDMADLSARFGSGFVYLGRTLDQRYVCAQYSGLSPVRRAESRN
jgi:hypothetical protein